MVTVDAWRTKLACAAVYFALNTPKKMSVGEVEEISEADESHCTF